MNRLFMFSMPVRLMRCAMLASVVFPLIISCYTVFFPIVGRFTFICSRASEIYSCINICTTFICNQDVTRTKITREQKKMTLFSFQIKFNHSLRTIEIIGRLLLDKSKRRRWVIITTENSLTRFLWPMLTTANGFSCTFKSWQAEHTLMHNAVSHCCSQCDKARQTHIENYSIRFCPFRWNYLSLDRIFVNWIRQLVKKIFKKFFSKIFKTTNLNFFVVKA